MVTTKYLAKFQNPRAITWPKIIGPERNIISICNLSLYSHIPNIKSISQSIAKRSVNNCFISELQSKKDNPEKLTNIGYIYSPDVFTFVVNINT
jgi:hypothetical protein